VKACIYPEEETENVKKLSKRHNDIIDQDNQEGNDEDINQSNLKTRKIYTKLERRKHKYADNKEVETVQKTLNTKFLEKIKNIESVEIKRWILKKNQTNKLDVRAKII